MTKTGDLIKAKREELGISQSALAKELGFSSVFLLRIESGKCGLPACHVKSLAKILGLNLRDIKSAIKKDFQEKLEEWIETKSEAFVSKKLSPRKRIK